MCKRLVRNCALVGQRLVWNCAWWGTHFENRRAAGRWALSGCGSRGLCGHQSEKGLLHGSRVKGIVAPCISSVSVCARHSAEHTAPMACEVPRDSGEPALQCVAVLCGLPAAGKTTLCQGVVTSSAARGVAAVHHCFDAVLWGGTPAASGAGFSAEAWKVHMQRTASVTAFSVATCGQSLCCLAGVQGNICAAAL